MVFQLFVNRRIIIESACGASTFQILSPGVGMGRAWTGPIQVHVEASLFYKVQISPFNRSDCTFKPNLVLEIYGTDTNQFDATTNLRSYNSNVSHALSALII